MPYVLDEEKLNSADLKVLDINQPPVKSVAHMAFPQMVYLHPRDKSKLHRMLLVQDRSELEAAEKRGYKAQPHVPSEPMEDLSVDFEAEEHVEKRGPGRPRNVEAA